MEASLDLNAFAKILNEKGYDGYFHTQGAYAGKLKESLGEYLENCQKGTDSFPIKELVLRNYLQWSGEDKPYVECSMRVEYLNGKFSLNSIEIVKKNQFGQVLKKSGLAGLSVISVPQATEAVTMVNEDPMQKSRQSPKRFKF